MSELAERIYRGIFANPKHFAAVHGLGALLLQAGSAAEAEMALRCAEQLNSRSPEVHNNLGLALARQGKLREALACYDRALTVKPAFPSALLNKAVVLSRLGDALGAMLLCDRALTLEQSPELHFNRGVALDALGRAEDAADAYRAALALKPDFPAALNNLGNALAACGKLEEAQAVLDRAVAATPGAAAALVNRGAVALQRRTFDAAEQDFDDALTLDPSLAEAWCNRGNVRREKGDIAGALSDYERTLAIQPRDAQALWNRGMTRLLVGDWPRAWADYELRHARKPDVRDQLAGISPWRGEDLQGRSILVFSEQGLGDCIQFSRLTTLLAEQGAGVTLLVPARLRRLLDGLANVEVVDEISQAKSFDVWAPLMSLPRYLGLTPENIPPIGAPYLTAEPALLQRWAARIGDRGLKVAIAWQGNPGGSIDSGRSIPLHDFRPLAKIEGLRLISVQSGFGTAQLRGMPEIETWPDMDSGPDGFLDTAAILTHCDLVITSDTSVAHLAGALGRPTWLALKLVPDWRWLLAREDTPWYPSVRLFRQRTLDDWAGVFSKMAQELAALRASA